MLPGFRTMRSVGFLIKAPFILVMLFVINLVTSPGHWWVQWAALGIGIAWFFALLRVEAMRLAWRDRLTLLGDPEFCPVPHEKLLSDNYAAECAEKILAAVKARSDVPIVTDVHEPGQVEAVAAVADVVQIPVADGTIPAYRASPTTGGPFPVVLVVQEIFGVHEHIRDVCRRFAKQGYLAVAPELYARQGDPSKYADWKQLYAEIVLKVPDAQVMSDLDAAVEALVSAIVAKPRVALAMGKELFYRAADGRLMAVPILSDRASVGFQNGAPVALPVSIPAAGTVNRYTYQPSTDGQRFLVPVPLQSGAKPMTVDPIRAIQPTR